MFSRTALNTTPTGAASAFGAMKVGIAFERTGGQLFSL